MIIIYGNRLFGKVDQVPGGLFHVATDFLHIFYIPIFPKSSQVILEKNGNEWRGVPIGWNWKSIILAWARVLLIFKGLSALMVGLTAIDSSATRGVGIVGICMALALFGAAIATWWLPIFTRAKLERAMELADKIGAGPELMAAIEAAYANEDEDENDEPREMPVREQQARPAATPQQRAAASSTQQRPTAHRSTQERPAAAPPRPSTATTAQKPAAKPAASMAKTGATASRPASTSAQAKSPPRV